MNSVAKQHVSLPRLREDLQLLKGPIAFDGSPTWNIYDPVCNKYFRIGWSVFQLISRWSIGNARELLDRVKNETTAQVKEEDVENLISFLHSNSLTRDSASGSSTDYLAQYMATQTSWFVFLIKNYLFIRIPIFRPHRFLKKTMPLVKQEQ